MIGPNVETAIAALFPAAGAAVVDVKFFAGYSSQVTAEQLAGQLLSADRQIADGLIRVEDIDAD